MLVVLFVIFSGGKTVQ